MANGPIAIETTSYPVAPSDRLDSIDATRGLALFGVMAINLVFEFRISIFQQFLGGTATASPLDSAVERFLLVAVDSKAFALFSILFGVGLAIQFERLAGNRRRTILLLRRLIVLLAIGLVHLFLIWNGDILTEYAFAGFVVLPFLFGPRWFLAVSSLLCLALYLTVAPLVSLPNVTWMNDHIAEAKRIYGDGSFSDVLAFRIQELVGILPLHIAVFFRTVALFLFGAFIWRTGLLRRASTNRTFLFTFAAVGIPAGLAATLTSFATFRAVAPIVLASGYGAIIVGLMTTSTGRMILGWARPLGRMAFTNYVAQSVIFGWIFYGYWLGLFDRLGVAGALSSGIVVYAAQAIFSKWWLKHHRFGPLEWLWRTLMYGKPQTMHLANAPA